MKQGSQILLIFAIFADFVICQYDYAYYADYESPPVVPVARPAGFRRLAGFRQSGGLTNNPFARPNQVTVPNSGFLAQYVANPSPSYTYPGT